MAADEERAARVRERYEILKTERPGFTWGTVAGHVGISERSVLGWQKTGGIDAKHLKKAAEVLECDPDWLWRGPRPDTPDLSLKDVRDEFTPRVDVVQRELDEIKTMLLEATSERRAIERAVAEEAANIAKQNQNLEDQTVILAELGTLVQEIRALVSVLQDVDHIERVVGATVRRVLPAPEPGPAAKRAASAKRQPQPPVAKRTA